MSGSLWAGGPAFPVFGGGEELLLELEDSEEREELEEKELLEELGERAGLCLLEGLAGAGSRRFGSLLDLWWLWWWFFDFTR